ncbi:DNA repair protein RecO [Nakamurella antarctica]|uniref:DNA repair protein RecO n=1 Tax=Nakamurella antarctica TaxID=1902245 RepID=A0A3G8ZM89_9ACTN|nr:DNA repair protein RecO [Nakamurella antarctica]AZI58278.1 DNA repair protein RecO [Nakamurella antarctica]
MTVYRDTAVVLRVGKLGEADRIVTLLTRHTGRVRAVAKGVRRTKSKFGARLEPFSHVDVQLYAGRNLDIVTQAESLDSFGAKLTSDYGRYTTASAMVETSERLTAEEREPSLKLYLLLVSALRALAETERDPSLILDAFLLRAMGLAGWAPALSECAKCGAPGPHSAFNVAAGGALCVSCRSGAVMRPAPGSVVLMQALATGDWATAEAGESTHRREASGLVAALVQWHLERGLRSLPMVERSAPAELPDQIRTVAAPRVDTGFADAFGARAESAERESTDPVPAGVPLAIDDSTHQMEDAELTDATSASSGWGKVR